MFIDEPKILLDPATRLLHLRHGPIDLFLFVDTDSRQDQQEAYRCAAFSFKDILPTLCGELDVLRSPMGHPVGSVDGKVAKRMIDAASHYADAHFVTPMIAVAGSVADYLVDLLGATVEARRIYVNNGGDISVKLAEGETFSVGICSDINSGRIGAQGTVSFDDGIGGIATSGWAGRSHSLGIADAVTVLAPSAALADVAATLIANEVDLPNSIKVERAPAHTLAPDSDLGARLVTTRVLALTDGEIGHALGGGRKLAQELIADGLVHTVYLSLQGVDIVIGPGSRGILPIGPIPVSKTQYKAAGSLNA